MSSAKWLSFCPRWDELKAEQDSGRNFNKLLYCIELKKNIRRKLCELTTRDMKVLVNEKTDEESLVKRFFVN